MSFEYTIKAIPTEYNGVMFRSRLEATWAAFFDLCGWNWVYEPFDLDGWTPDFIIKGSVTNTLCEVKPIDLTPRERRKRNDLSPDYVFPRNPHWGTPEFPHIDAYRKALPHAPTGDVYAGGHHVVLLGESPYGYEYCFDYHTPVVLAEFGIRVTGAHDRSRYFFNEYGQSVDLCRNVDGVITLKHSRDDTLHGPIEKGFRTKPLTDHECTMMWRESTNIVRRVYRN